MIINILSSKEKKEMEFQLEKQFGITKLPHSILKTNAGRIKLFTGNITAQDLEILQRLTPIEGIGLYIGKDENGEIRLSIEGSQLLANQITKNIFQLDEQQLKQWMQGSDLQIHTGKKGTYIMEYQNDFLGSGKISEEKISNYIPKGRRIKQSVL